MDVRLVRAVSGEVCCGLNSTAFPRCHFNTPVHREGRILSPNRANQCEAPRSEANSSPELRSRHTLLICIPSTKSQLGGILVNPASRLAPPFPVLHRRLAQAAAGRRSAACQHAQAVGKFCWFPLAPERISQSGGTTVSGAALNGAIGRGDGRSVRERVNL
ncbi:hypothetical protein Q7C36_014239 [Tachysurus vachellii]|uniref:Uncharacterized protein n=1 Tax=Tachysurus vachellii TaxID=175792 RepID=A0AA88SM79_TACVA|nr:hypothetical protein Q7C36_014239 [Tachysurus vachellii]